MKKRLPRKEKKYAKQQGGYWQYSLCLYCRHNEGMETSVTQPNGNEKYYMFRQRKRHSGRVNTWHISSTKK